MSDTPSRRPVFPIKVVAAAAPEPDACCGGDGHDHDHGHDHHAHEVLSHDTHDHDTCCAPASPTATAAPRHDPPPEGSRSTRFRIDKMDCPTEERLIRNKLEPMAGIARLDFNLMARELTVHHSLPDPASVQAALNALDMAPRLLQTGDAVQALPPALPPRTKWLLAASGLSAIGAEAIAWASGLEAHPGVIALAAVSIGAAGLPTLKKGWIALRHLTINIYFLMTLAVSGALVIGKWSEAAMVVFLFALAEAIEAVSLERARKAIEALTVLAPDMASVWRQGQWQETPVSRAAVGERIRIRAGERVPLDARITQGQASLDQAPITGESMPVDKRTGDEVYAGTIVADGSIEAQVIATAGHSMLARIAQAIQTAQAQRAPTQRFVDQFARYYTPAVVALALAMALGGPWLFGGSGAHWLYQALVLLVIACPCALVVSTPVTVVSGLAYAARQGILIKGGAYLEHGHKLKAVALDKTGTLTRGQPVLTDVLPLARQGAQQGPMLTSQAALRMAASLDQHSSHPIARALVATWRERDPGAKPWPVEFFAVQQGRGVKGVVDGRTWQLGNHRMVEDMGQCSPELEARIQTLAQQGKTAFVLMDDHGPAAILAMADALRPDSRQAIDALKQLGVRAVMLSGDNQNTARDIARQAGIDDVRGELLPAAKLQAINELIAQHGEVAMVGDGVNDAPAMARASIGIAMGAAGTATALETADVAIMDDDPRKVARFIRISQATSSVLKQNIALALGIKAVFVALALGGMATLWMAVFADVGASLLVVFNGLRLLRLRDH